MRCHVCNKDCPDHEIKLERRMGKLTFSPCQECLNIIQRTVLIKELEDEDTPTIPIWDLD